MNVSLGDHQRFEPEEFWKWPTTIVMLLTSQFPGRFSWSILDYGNFFFVEIYRILEISVVFLGV